MEESLSKKKLTVVIPCFNEVENVISLVDEVRKVTNEKLPNYITEILFIDNDSTDGTRDEIRKICAQDKGVKAIFNARNFGHIRSPYYALTQADGDIVMLMCADFQDPPELIPEFVKKWEEGYRIVVGTKAKSKTNPFIHLIRRLYYKIIKSASDVRQIENFTGFGLYDQSFIKVLRDLNDPYPYMRGIVAEFGFKMYEFPYVQPERRAGKTHNNFGTLYDMAMNGLTSYTNIYLRIATFLGVFFSFLSVVGCIVYCVFLGLYFDYVSSLIVFPILIAICFALGLILFFLGMIGEYVLQINKRVIHRPLVVEEERINFAEGEGK